MASAAKRERILAVAEEMFSVGHYHEVAMDEIARRASVAKGTLYNYFDSKDDLYVSILQQGLDGLLDQIKTDKLNGGTSAFEALETIVERLLSFFMEKQSFLKMFLREDGRLFTESEDCYDKVCTMKDLMAEHIRRGTERGEFRNMDPDFAAQMLMGMVKTAVRDVENRPFRPAELVDLFVRGIERRN